MVDVPMPDAPWPHITGWNEAERKVIEAYAAQVEAATIERCARVCESVELGALFHHTGWLKYTSDLCLGLAAAIRALDQTREQG